MASLSAIETAALAGTPAGTKLEVVLEPTGAAWLPVAVLFTARGHRVFRVSCARAADLRRLLSRHAKSNGIDADTSARLPLIDPTRLTAVIEKASNNHQGRDRALAWRAAAVAAVELYADHPAVAFDDLAAEVATEVALLRATQAELAIHTTEREHAYRFTDMGALARSLPGLGEIGAPVLVAAIGRPGRFPRAAAFTSFTGLAPRASETANTDRKGQPMSTSGRPRPARQRLPRARQRLAGQGRPSRSDAQHP